MACGLGVQPGARPDQRDHFEIMPGLYHRSKDQQAVDGARIIEQRVNGVAVGPEDAIQAERQHDGADKTHDLQLHDLLAELNQLTLSAGLHRPFPFT